MIATAGTPVSSEQQVAQPAPQAKPRPRTVDDVISFIRQDARKNALTYLMRSNTAHDGE